MKIRLVNEHREANGNRYTAWLEIDGKIVGRVERGWRQGGRRSNDYVAVVATVTVAEARTLAELRRDLAACPPSELAPALREYEGVIRVKIEAADRDEAADLLVTAFPLPSVEGVEIVESDVLRADGTAEEYA